MKFETDKNDLLHVRVDKTRKINAHVLMRAMGLSDNDVIIEVSEDGDYSVTATDEDGCEVIVIRNWIPLTYQTAYWGQQFSIEKEEIFERILDVLTNTLNEHNLTHNELGISSFVPLIFTGKIKDTHLSNIDKISKNLDLTNTQLEIPSQLPNGFKTDDFLINLGLLMSQKNFKID